MNSQQILKGLKSILFVDRWIERCKTLKSCAPESQLIIPEQTWFGEKGNYALPMAACSAQQWDLSVAMSYEYLSDLQRYHFPLRKHFFGPSSSLRNLVESCIRRIQTLVLWGCTSPKPSSLAFCRANIGAAGLIENLDCE